MMRFEEHNAPIPDDKTLEYFEKEIAWGEQALGYGLLALGYRVPIYFVSEAKINREGARNLHDRIREEWELREIDPEFDENCEAKICSEDKGVGDIDDIISPLGIYFPMGAIQHDGPEIWVSYEKIRNLFPANQVKYITLLVLVHELAHGAMDSEQNGNYTINSWVEEPLANLITLEYLDAVGPSRSSGTLRMDITKDFIAHQSVKYKLGLDMFDAKRRGYEIDWRRWRKSKWCMQPRIRQLLIWRKNAIATINNIDYASLANMYNMITMESCFKQGVLNAEVALHSGMFLNVEEKAAFVADRFIKHDQNHLNGNGLAIVVAKNANDVARYLNALNQLLANAQMSATDDPTQFDVQNSRILVTDTYDQNQVWTRGVCAVYKDKR